MDIYNKDAEVFENTVASLVDMASILFAYQIGLDGFGFGMGMIYAAFDAFLVVWMRKPIARFVRSISPYRRAKKMPVSQDEATPLPNEPPAVQVLAAGTVVAPSPATVAQSADAEVSI